MEPHHPSPPANAPAGGNDMPGGSPGLSASSHAFDMVAAALHRAASSMQSLGPRQSEAARLLRLGQMEPAFAEVAACVGLWQDVRGALDAAGAAIGQPVERLAALVLTPSGTSAGNPVAELTRALEQLKASVQGRDWIGLADALEYDLGDLAHRWRTALLQPDGAEESAPGGTPELSRSAPAA
jgi:hypothetical protein